LLEAVAAGGLGAALALDRTAFLQTMASRPLVACALAGAALGNLEIGLRCGFLLELLWLMELPVGASVPPDDTLASVLAVSFSIAAPPDWSIHARSALGILAAVPFGMVGRSLDLAVRRANGKLLVRARLEEANLGRLHFRGALCFAGAGGVTAGGGALLGGKVIRWLAPLLPSGGEAGFELAAALLPLVGVAAVLAALRGRRHAVLFGAGFLGGLGFVGVLEGSRGPWRS
jgi:mannose/fructose/N-acetylgalactosamine-specific phosphotransferase system component IIC